MLDDVDRCPSCGANACDRPRGSRVSSGSISDVVDGGMLWDDSGAPMTWDDNGNPIKW
jgi:hypothetical protein